MASNGSGRPTDAYHDNRNFTTVVLHGRRDCQPDTPGYQPDLLVYGGARINKRLCVGGEGLFGGDVVVGGNLFVLGSQVVEREVCITVEDKNICLGSVIGEPSTDLTANGGGVVIKGPQPSGSKSWLWYNDIGPDGSWHSNQDINIGQGRYTAGLQSDCYACGSDTDGQGQAYRINGISVLSENSLGSGVLNSSLVSVGVLREGSVDVATSILSTVPSGSGTIVMTSVPHLLSVGDMISISGASQISGCDMVTSVLSPTEFVIGQSTVAPGVALGVIRGPNFPVNIGTSDISTGTHTVLCGKSLIVQNAFGLNRFVFDGANEQLQLTNTSSKAFAQSIVANYPLAFADTQRALQINNTSQSTTPGSVSIGADIQQCYSGTNTTFPNINDTVIHDGIKVTMKTNTQSPIAKISSRGIDVTSNSQSNQGSNVGLIAEAGGSPGTEHSAGVIGITNEDSGTFSTGVLGCAHQDRNDLANLVTSVIGAGGLSVGVFACNPKSGPGDFAIYAMGASEFIGEVQIEGNLMATGDISSASVTTPLACVTDLVVDSIIPKNGTDILLSGNLFPSIDNFYSLGEETRKFSEGWFGNLHVCDTATIKDLYVTGNLFASVPAFVLPDPLIVGNLIADNVHTDFLDSKTGDSITILANLIPDSTGCLSLGSQSSRWCEAYFDNAIVENLTAQSIIATTACFDEALVDFLVPKNGNEIHVMGNLNPTEDNMFSLGNIANQWLQVSAQSAFFDTLTVFENSEFIGNVSVDSKLTVNELCVTNDAIIVGDLVVLSGNLFAGFVNIQGNCIYSSDGSSRVCVYSGGEVDLKGNTTVYDDLHVFGETSFNNNVDINGKLTVADLCVLGNTAVDSLTANTIVSNGDTFIQGNLRVVGSSQLEFVSADTVCANTICFMNDRLNFGCKNIYGAEVVTVNNVTLSPIVIPLLTESVALIQAKVVITNTADPSNAKVFEHNRAVVNNSGTLNWMGIAIQPNYWANGPGTDNWDMFFQIDNTNIVVTTTGEIGKTLNWKLCVETISTP